MTPENEAITAACRAPSSDLSQLTRELVLSLRGKECPGCVGPKKPAMSFCADCYGSLPRPLKRRLYERIGEGYEDAFLAAKEFLEQGI